MEFLVASSESWWNWSTLGWGLALSAAGLTLSLLLMGVVIVRLPDDYFAELPAAPAAARGRLPVWRAGVILKNLVGLLVIAVGVVLLLLPGQGILTVLVGVMICDFPGKRRLERLLVGWPGVLAAINSLRQRWGRNPLTLSAVGDR